MTDQLPFRRSIRLRGYDYSQQGLYFVTICTHQHQCLFGEICDDEMVLSPYGEIAYNQWIKIPTRFPHIELGEFIVMPNHIHGIIEITTYPVGETLAVARNNTNIHDDMIGNTSLIRATARVAPTIGNMVGAYKSLVHHECLKIGNTIDTLTNKIWQRNYYEHIIRNDLSLHKIAQYIIENPVRWKDDCFYE